MRLGALCIYLHYLKWKKDTLLPAWNWRTFADISSEWCSNLLPASPRVWSIWLSAGSAESRMLVWPRMPHTSASMPTDMTSKTRNHRNLQWLSTSIDTVIPCNTLPSWLSKNFVFSSRRERFWIDKLGCMAFEGMNLIWCAYTSQNCTVTMYLAHISSIYMDLICLALFLWL